MPYQRRRTPIGQRRERVELWARSSTADGIGGQTPTWNRVATTWAGVTPLDERGKEAVEGGQLTGLHNYHFDLRYRNNIRPGVADRLVWRDRTLEIRTIVDDEAMGRRLIVQAAEVQGSDAAS